ncbi:MAG: hypothetical protein P8P90_05810, partial [Opitutales bacterium]|nr:hypothetical protein [Opitutales bacterium]
MAEQPESSGGKSLLGRCSDFPDSFECSAIGKHSLWLGLCSAHRVTMGICLPGRYDDYVFVGE